MCLCVYLFERDYAWYFVLAIMIVCTCVCLRAKSARTCWCVLKGRVVRDKLTVCSGQSTIIRHQNDKLQHIYTMTIAINYVLSCHY